jgi:hypothetical protein
MSAKEETDLREKPEAEDAGEDVVGHAYMPDEVGDDDPERKRKRKRKVSEAPGEDDFGRKRK